jgi:pimeloyl-CoA dehydrogenase
VRALELTNWRFLLDPEIGRKNPGFASVLKVKGSETMQELTSLIARLAGPAGLQRRDGEGPDALHPLAAASPRYFFFRAATIYGGSSEVQKDILAKTLLG